MKTIISSQRTSLSFDYENQRKLMKEERFAGKQNSAGEMGHRIAKHSYDKDQAYNNGLGQLVKSTYYVLDAQGNTMATYERSIDNGQTSLTYTQTEKFIYGSSRLGVQNCSTNLLGSAGTATYVQLTVPHRIGKKGYELSNHLGNVLSVISDKAIPHDNGGVVDYFLADIRQAQDFSPFGVLLQNRNLSLSGANPYRYGYQGQKMDDEVKGDGNSYDFGARMLDSRVGRFLSIDAHASKYVGLSPYNFVANNPLIYVDPDGNDIVYFDSKGNETKRTESNSQFEARVDLKGDGNYSVAPMPNIIKGYEEAKYQQYDYIIAAETYIFNNTSPSERPKSANGLTLDGAQPVALSPTLVKAIILEETMLGNYNGEAGQNGKSDIMQANVTTTDGKTDWNDSKAQYGLEKGKSATPQQSVHAGIMILFSKGLLVKEVKFNNGKPSEDSKVSWKGGNLKSWWVAVKSYNGNNSIDKNGKPHKENYVKSIFKNWNNSFFSKNSKYYVPAKK